MCLILAMGFQIPFLSSSDSTEQSTGVICTIILTVGLVYSVAKYYDEKDNS
jgi:hypothetical protein